MTRPGKRTWPRREIWVPVLLFLVALGLRLLFWQATPDAAAPYPAYYKGDAPSWLAYARALQESQVFELDLELLSIGVEKHQAAFSSGTWLTGTPLTYLAPW